MRTDLDTATQMYVVGAVQTGFHLQQPALGSPEETAAALHHTVRAAVEPQTAPEPEALAAAAPAVVARYVRFHATLAAAIGSQEGPT